MLVALISDLHGNLVALDAVLNDLRRDGPDQVVRLGDVAATGPRPRETVGRLRALDCTVVMGNADEELLRPPLRSVPRKEANDRRRMREIDRWCAGQLSSADSEYVRQFRPMLGLTFGRGRTLPCFHGSPRSFDDVVAAKTRDDELDKTFSGHDATMMAGGRTHEQLVRRHRETTVLNPGSVGLNPSGAEYALIESSRDRLRVELRRLPLPAEHVKRATLESGMPHAQWWASF